MSEPILSLVVAVAANGVIGADGDMPWKLSSDLKRFRRLTMGKPVVMGRKTFASIGRPLDGRTNIVVTRDDGFRPEGATVVSDLAAALAAARLSPGGDGEIMVIGGGTIYGQLIGDADRLYVTHVDAAPAGDTRFPAIDPDVWAVVSEEPIPRTERDSAEARFVVYERRGG
ncbi:dihydrofolate reductase [Methylobrevis pamukkalensis]|uniref:Dihydrofolate reductase n=1 Tax=Methylobrevis pamukkalensis TaxID=1439726 RepID=A0A1E3H327_9HYPH|nr:dihydrofolate reductase [Methylobrevis pamukkalensis]ODN70722.1 Dihydrofolate reductase type 3 [Methylobrevis pamukkalensis]